MTQRYVRPTVGGWLLPGIVGSFTGTYATIVAHALFWGDFGTIWRGVGLVAGMILGTAWVVLYLAILLGTDVLLLLFKLRTLPAGGRAWLVALLNPVVIAFAYRIVPPYKFYASGPWGVAFALLIPAVITIVASRVLFGSKPPR